MMLSHRAAGALMRTGYHTFLEVLAIYPHAIVTLPGIGKKSVEEIKKKIQYYILKVQPAVRAYCSGDLSAMYSDEFVYETTAACFEDIGFRGVSFKEIRAAFPENFEEARIKKCIGGMLREKKLEYVDFRLYRVYPSVFEAIKESSLDPESKEILTMRFQGMTLDEIGKQLTLTRERIRQRSIKSFEKLKIEQQVKYGSAFFDEDYYAYLYSGYEVTKELWTEYLGVPDRVFTYLSFTLSKGNQAIDEALNDPLVELNLKFKIQDYLNRNKILIDGNWLEKQRSDIEDYALAKLAGEEISFEDFAEQYNALLKENGIDFDEKIYYTDEMRRSRKNRIAESMLCLWKHGEMLRYYDIAAHDYEELLETLNMSRFSDIEISTLKFIEDYPAVMKKYDIRDQYELHNLLKKIVNTEDYNDMFFPRQPIIRFGAFDKREAYYQVLEAVAPVTTAELMEYIHMEYGYDKLTIAAYCSQLLSEYYHQGMFVIEFKKIADDKIEVLKNALTEDFYYISEIKKFYKEAFDGADIEEINPHSLKALGFLVFGTYVIQNHETAEAYFTHILTKDDVYDISEYNKKFASLKQYHGTYRELRLNYDILLFETDKVITMNRLRNLGIEKADIQAFCDEVNDFVDDNQYFTIHSLKNNGFTSKLDVLGFDDYFYAMLLSADPRFLWQRIFGEIVLLSNADGFEKSISKKTFLSSILSEYDSIDIDEFTDECMEMYGVKIPAYYEVIRAIANTDFYYDKIMEKIYKNKNIYYEELDD